MQIYVSRALIRQVQVGPGPYSLDRLPVNAGLGDVRVVVRDPFGNQQQFSVGLYQPTGVLRRGEHDFQFVGGKLRDDTGPKPTYGDWQGTAFERVGVSDWLTVGYTGEGSKDVVAGGPTLSMRLAKMGELELNTWGSQTAAKTRGFAVYGVYTFVAPFLNVTARPALRRRLLEPVCGKGKSARRSSISCPAFRCGAWQRHLRGSSGPRRQPRFTLPDGASTRRRSGAARRRFG